MTTIFAIGETVAIPRRLRSKRMHEINRRTFRSELPQQCFVPRSSGFRLDEVIPADMRHTLLRARRCRARHHPHAAGKNAEAQSLTELLARIKQDLHADTDA